MNIAIVGTGYVGLVSGTCFAEMGVNVTCVDVNEEKIRSLQSGKVPIYEPGLDEMVLRNQREGRLRFTTDLKSCLNDVEVVFSAVSTPPDEDGSADLQYVLEVAKEFGENIQKYTVLVTKSTVPVGTARKVKAVIQEELAKLNHFFRDYRANKIKSIDPGLFDQLYRLQGLLGTRKPVQLISGYRSIDTNNELRARSRGVAKKSYHTKGQAMDFHIEGIALSNIRKAALSMRAGGVGYYPRSNFVHIDTGPARHW